jgi:MFS family permease
LTIVVFTLGVFLFWVALYIYLPTLPVYIQSKAGSLATVGVVLAQYGLWLALVRLPVGIAADWVGQRKPFILVGIFLVGLGAWLLAVGESATGLAVGRAITGVSAATWVPIVVMFSSLYPAREAVRATALVTTVCSLGRALAPSVTGFLNELGGYSLAFYLAAAIAGLAFLMMLPLREEARPSGQISLAGIGRLFRRRDVLVPSLLDALVQYAVWAIPLAFLSIQAAELGATGVTQSLLVSLHLGLVAVGNFLAAMVVSRMAARKLIAICLVVMSASIGATALAPTLPLIFVSQFWMGLAHGVLFPVLMGMSIEYVADAERTTAMGLHQSVYAAGIFLGPWLSGLLAEAIGIRPMMGVTAFAFLLVGLLLTRFLVNGPTDSRDSRVL